MSDNSNKKTTAQQGNMQPSHGEQFRSYLKSGLNKTAVKYGEVSQSSHPHTGSDAARIVGQSAMAGAQDFGKSAKHLGMGLMQEAHRQNPNDGQQLNTMKINQSITQGRSDANQMSQNQGINNFRNKANGQAGNTSKNSFAGSSKGTNASVGKTNNSTNRGISSFQNKASGQSSSGTGKGSSASSGQSSGSGKGR